MRIPESELIINGDGSVFHIHLKPEELADNVIMVGDPSRVDMIGEYLTDIEFRHESREFVSITGRRNGKRVIAIVLGSSTSNERDEHAARLLSDALGAICFKKDITDIHFGFHSKRKQICFFTIGDDEIDNVNDSLKLIDKYGLPQENGVAVAITLRIEWHSSLYVWRCE